MSKQCSISSTELLTIVNEHLSQSIELEKFLPAIIQTIQSYLNCEQVFICYFSSQGEEEIITNNSQNNPENFHEIIKNSFKEENRLKKLQENQYHSTNDEETNDSTQPLIKSELTLPIVIKTPEVSSFLLDDLWGLLFIYDYDGSRIWQEIEIKTIQLVIKQITLAIERKIIYEQLHLKNKQLEESQLLDNLTQLPNYNSFIDCLEFEWLRLAREKEYLSLIMIAFEIPNNYQKQVILPKIANSFAKIAKRTSDLCARYSEQKFTVLLPKTNNNGASIVADQIYHLIQEILVNYHNIVFNLSVITCIPQRKSDYTNFLTAAENSLDEAIQNKININLK
jgi:diguanylate cyclase (GGDEF)-like protein